MILEILEILLDKTYPQLAYKIYDILKKNYQIIIYPKSFEYLYYSNKYISNKYKFWIPDPYEKYKYMKPYNSMLCLPIVALQYNNVKIKINFVPVQPKI